MTYDFVRSTSQLLAFKAFLLRFLHNTYLLSLFEDSTLDEQEGGWLAQDSRPLLLWLNYYYQVDLGFFVVGYSRVHLWCFCCEGYSPDIKVVSGGFWDVRLLFFLLGEPWSNGWEVW